ncbi:MAG: prepilin-type N-terminal cleavage/methylation domain-containing protein [Thermoguttaceae bacterium]|jgi:type II secretory pathway pseudopilin PulG|nr:prepilin-type N-terminal cleavage/methylation domain-containing protein [Thermoguttaceae bacterium]
MVEHLERDCPAPARRHRRRGAFSLVELAVSAAIAGLLLVAALRTVASSIATQSQAAIASMADLLAEDLLAEILEKSYADPVSSAGLGVDAGESPSAKTSFDDVDDYAGWNEAPPQARDGTAMTGWEGWQRQVAVAWVIPTDVSQTTATESGAKRITVTVRYRGATRASRNALRTSAP